MDCIITSVAQRGRIFEVAGAIDFYASNLREARVAKRHAAKLVRILKDNRGLRLALGKTFRHVKTRAHTVSIKN